MKNKNLILMISAILFTTTQVLPMEGGVEEFPAIIHNEKENISIDPLDSFPISIEKTVELPPKRKISKTLPFKRRKSSESPKMRDISLPNQTMAFPKDQRKGRVRERKESSSSFQDEQQELPRCIITAPQEEKKESPRPGFKRYSLVGPIEFMQIPLPNSFQVEQNDFSKYNLNAFQEKKNESPRDQSPMCSSKDPVL